jgi:hypothetical protein
MISTPVAFFVFNRPELTSRVFERIRQAQPTKLFVVCDGARQDRPEDEAKVAAVREIVSRVDWPCEVKRNYAESNMGCRQRVASGLNWVFAQVEEAIILEDDTLPDSSFFPFCQELLKRYRDDPRVMHIGGCNLAAPHMKLRESYWFTRHAWIWGWATWRRAWKLYDFEMRTWEDRLPLLERTFACRWERQYWLSSWQECRLDPKKANTWDFPWMYSVRASDGLAILPRVNLIENIGIGADATHTTDENLAGSLALPAEKVSFPLVHPSGMNIAPFRDNVFTAVRGGGAMGSMARLRLWAQTVFSGHLQCSMSER